MKVLQGDYRSWQPLDRAMAVTIGVYDGVHLGHQYVLRSLAASGLPVVVVTFRTHPLQIIAPEAAPKMLTSVKQRLELFEELGVFATAVVDFDEDFRRLAAEEFVEKLLVATLRAQRVAVGRGFRFGHQQLGDVDLLRSLGSAHGYTVDDVNILEEGVPVRSTVIRALLAEGDVAAARRLLGRDYRLVGAVTSGEQRGRAIGLPIAIMECHADALVPGSAVYAVKIHVAGHLYGGVVNIGKGPTFGGTESVVQFHIFDFEGDPVGQQVSMDFVARLRAEHKFGGVDELAAAIRDDVVAAREILEGS